LSAALDFASVLTVAFLRSRGSDGDTAPGFDSAIERSGWVAANFFVLTFAFESEVPSVSATGAIAEVEPFEVEPIEGESLAVEPLAIESTDLDDAETDGESADLGDVEAELDATIDSDSDVSTASSGRYPRVSRTGYCVTAAIPTPATKAIAQSLRLFI